MGPRGQPHGIMAGTPFLSCPITCVWTPACVNKLQRGCRHWCVDTYLCYQPSRDIITCLFLQHPRKQTTVSPSLFINRWVIIFQVASLHQFKDNFGKHPDLSVYTAQLQLLDAVPNCHCISVCFCYFYLWYVGSVFTACSSFGIYYYNFAINFSLPCHM